jgi:hypothetical protein
MKKFIVLMSLVGMLSSCTVNTSTVRSDEGMKEVKYDGDKQYDKVKNTRNSMIKLCNKNSDSCVFIKKYDIEHYVIFLKNEKLMNDYKGNIIDIGNEFCISSNTLHIPSKFHISSPYTFFLLNGDMELYRNRHLFI